MAAENCHTKCNLDGILQCTHIWIKKHMVVKLWAKDVKIFSVW